MGGGRPVRRSAADGECRQTKQAVIPNRFSGGACWSPAESVHSIETPRRGLNSTTSNLPLPATSRFLGPDGPRNDMGFGFWVLGFGSAVSRQQSAVSNQPPAISHEPSAMSAQPPNTRSDLQPPSPPPAAIPNTLSFRTALAVRSLLFPCRECALDRNTTDRLNSTTSNRPLPATSRFLGPDGPRNDKGFGLWVFGFGFWGLRSYKNHAGVVLQAGAVYVVANVGQDAFAGG